MGIEERFTSPLWGGRERSERVGVETKNPHPILLRSSSFGGSTSPQGGGERIIAIARSWIGTPYVHQASLKGVGCDCLGLLRGVWRELRGEEPEDTPPYSADWAEATGVETLYMALKRHLTEISPCDAGREALLDLLQPGDVVLFRMQESSRATASLHRRGRGPAKHCGIVACRTRSFEAPRVTLRSERRERLDPPTLFCFGGRVPYPWSAVALAKAEGRAGHLRMTRAALTLIHARQNRRVSEEPFSPFWRQRLAYAFRL
jgi:NlpC/P60 family putative phage cell wall peptidase